MDFIFDPSLVLYLPLYQLDGSPFMSRDAYGHLCTVTGAMWTPQGRDFDGTDDEINCGNPDAFQIGTDPFTFIVWMKLENTNRVRFLGKKSTTWSHAGWMLSYADGGVGYGFIIGDGGGWDTVNYVDTDTTQWHQLAGTRLGTTATIFFDGERKNAKVSIRFDGNMNNAINFMLAWLSAFRYDGMFGEVLYYRKALSPLEIQNIYLATKWRYR